VRSKFLFLKNISFILWCSRIVTSYAHKTNNKTYLEKLKSITPDIDKILLSFEENKSILKDFPGFANNYLIKDIKREEIKLISTGDNLYIIKFEYFGNYIPITKDIDFSESGSNYSSGMGSSVTTDPEVEEAQNIKSSESTTVFEIQDRPNRDKELIKRILPYLSMGKKIIIQNPKYIENPTSLLVRYVVYNSKILFLILGYVSDATCFMKFRRLNTFEEYNEFLPYCTLNLNVTSFDYKNALSLVKINPALPWTDEIDNITVDTQFTWNHRSVANPNYNTNEYYKSIIFY
jgi:hypothetical protein